MHEPGARELRGGAADPLASPAVEEDHVRGVLEPPLCGWMPSSPRRARVRARPEETACGRYLLLQEEALRARRRVVGGIHGARERDL